MSLRGGVSLSGSGVTAQPGQPMAIVILHNFAAVAKLAQTFLDCPNEFAKYVLYSGQFVLWPLQAGLGIAGAWINAIDYDGLVDGRSIHYANYDLVNNQLLYRGNPPMPPSGSLTATHPSNTWATVDDRAPGYYVPLAHVTLSGAQIVANFLRLGLASPYLSGLGLTEAAIEAALASAAGGLQ